MNQKQINIRKYPPGSTIAVDNGCECPQMDNNYGRGTDLRGAFWFNQFCPLHGQDVTEVSTDGLGA